MAAASGGRRELAAGVTSWQVVEMAALLTVTVGMALTIFGEGLDPLLRVPTYFLCRS